MKTTKYLYKLFFIILLPLGMLLVYASSYSPEVVEHIYSKGIYKHVSQALSLATGIFPFSAAELIVVSLIVLALYAVLRTIIKSIKESSLRKDHISGFIINVLIALSLIYFGFIAIWGLNYQRMPFANISGLNVRPTSVKELEDICQDLVERTNNLRKAVNEDANGVMQIRGGYRDIFKRAYKGYEKAAEKYPELGGAYGSPKGVMMSVVMSYAGISGVYFPFTSEANVNILVPDSMLPCTATHEMAHQRGFAREDEANYIAYVTCIAHPDTDFQYSGTLLALLHSMSALSSHNRAKYSELSRKYSDDVKRDLQALNSFWKQYEGPVEEISNKINDTYLKANGQNDGVQSYGRMVDLLIAEYRLRAQK